MARPLLFVSAALGAAMAMRRLRSRRPQFAAPVARRVHHRATIRRPAAEVSAAWARMERLPLFFPIVVSVRSVDEGSRWTLLAPSGRTFECVVREVERADGQRLVWESSSDALHFRVTARFDPAPGDRGTELTVVLDWVAASSLGAVFARLMRTALSAGVRRFKQFVEAGEVATVTGQPTGELAEIRRPELRRPLRRRKDDVDVASALSFPASDPPASGRVS